MQGYLNSKPRYRFHTDEQSLRPGRLNRVRLFVANELTLIQMLWFRLLGDRPIVLMDDPLLRFLGPLVGKFRSILVKTGLVDSITNLSPKLPWLPKFPLERNYTHGVLYPVADMLHEEYLPPELELVFGEDAYPMHKMISDHLDKMKDLYLVNKWLEESVQDCNWHLYGAPRLYHSICSSLGHSSQISNHSLSRFWGILFNGVNAIGFWLAGIIWLALRIRVGGAQRLYFRVAADRVSTLDHYVYQQVVDDPSELVIVDRSKQLTQYFSKTECPHLIQYRNDARISFRVFGRLTLALTGALTRLLRYGGAYDPALFGRFASIPAKRTQFSAFFQRFQPAFFWGRDDYSTDHVIRNQELRKIGGTSLGVNHGVPINTFTSAWREVDFDIYYAYGKFLYETIYQKTWNPEMSVKPVGTLQMRREYLKRVNQPRPPDIAFFPVVIQEFERSIREVFKVARHFPDRRVYIKMKSGREDAHQILFRKLMGEAPLNVVVAIDSNPYELLLNVTYGICFSTLVVEALQFRVVTFNLDCDPNLEYQTYRAFPDLTVADGTEIIERIESIENESWSYEFKKFNNLVSMETTDIFDVIRQDIGLSPTFDVTSP